MACITKKNLVGLLSSQSMCTLILGILYDQVTVLMAVLLMVEEQLNLIVD